MFTKKSLVLLGVNLQREKAVLTLESNNDLIEGRLRLYNFNQEPDGILSLGFYDNKSVKKAGLVKSGNMLYTFKTDKNLNENFSCAVVNFIGANVKPILFGSTEGQNQEDVLSKIADEVMDLSSAGSVQKVLDDNGIEFDDDLKEEIDKTISAEIDKIDVNLDKHNEHPNCATCKYRKCFFGDEDNKQENNVRFIDDIKGQIDKIFENNPKENFLEEMIPSSKWVRVEFDDDGDYYILGLVYDENDNIKYICYGVPGIYQKTPPKQLSGFPVWFPLDVDKKESFGYWLTYQDAESGESIKAIVE